MEQQVIVPTTVHPSVGYSHAVRVGNMIFVSGQVARDMEGNPIPGGFEAQAEKVFENLRLVLEAAGASTKNVVKLNTYVKNMADRPILAKVRSRYFPDPAPASTLVEITALAQPELLIEVEAIAVV